MNLDGLGVDTIEPLATTLETFLEGGKMVDEGKHAVLLEALKTPNLRSVLHILINSGFVASARNSVAVDGKGEPIPWITYPAIAFLDNLVLSGKTIFEYGSGTSTLYWARRGMAVTSVENNMAWYTNVTQSLTTSNLEAKLLLRETEQPYVNSIFESSGKYDVVFVDGNFNRRKMAEQALARLAPKGFIILDNSDWPCRCSSNIAK